MVPTKEVIKAQLHADLDAILDRIADEFMRFLDQNSNLRDAVFTMHAQQEEIAYLREALALRADSNDIGKSN